MKMEYGQKLYAYCLQFRFYDLQMAENKKSWILTDESHATSVKLY